MSCATAPAIHGTADTQDQKSGRAKAPRASWPRSRSTTAAPRPIWVATYKPAKTRPCSPNASGAAAAISRVPNMVAITSSCISGCCGSNLSVSPAVWAQTVHRASSNTSVWKRVAPAQMLQQPLREPCEREDEHQVEEQFQVRRSWFLGSSQEPGCPTRHLLARFCRFCLAFRQSYHTAAPSDADVLRWPGFERLRLPAGYPPGGERGQGGSDAQMSHAVTLETVRRRLIRARAAP